MPDVTLDERQQRALRKVYAATPVPGHPLPERSVLAVAAQLVPCDAMGAVLVDGHGHVLDEVEIPHGHVERRSDGPGSHDDSPYYIGLMHWSQRPLQAAHCHALDHATDGVAIGFRNGPDLVAQFWVGRADRYFTEQDLAVLALITPALRRLMRERPTPRLPASLTVQERRVLMCVAAGHSNARIADELVIAESTVRKHLEHAFRKLGVSSRYAAVAALQGRDLPDQDLRERIERLG